MVSDASPGKYFDFIRVEMADPFWVDLQRLRYDVYCEELKFLDVSNYPSGLESDPFDPVSVQFAAVNAENQAVATLRLVRDSTLGFPLEQHAASLWPAFSALPRDKTVEISRLILSRHYRRRANDDRYGVGGTTPMPPRDDAPRPPVQRRSPYPIILFGLFRLMFEESVNTGLEWWLTAMEPWLRTYLSRFGFTFMPVGEPIEYYGQVVPYAAKIEDIFRAVAETKPEVLQMVLGGESAGSGATRPSG
jgi:N-acyl amino acid synthase of PEP-CTERM/exosortase system